MQLRTGASRRRRLNGVIPVETMEGRRLFAAGATGIESVAVMWNGEEHQARPNSWLVDFKNLRGDAPAQLRKANALLGKTGKGLKASRRLSADGLFQIAAPAGSKPAELHAALTKLASVSFFEPDFVVSAEATPNDLYYAGSEWALNNSGQTGGTIDADIDAPEAWNLAAGNGTVVVGVVDSGIDYNHPDLAANIWTNPNEIAGDGVDNDANGYVDDIHGWDFYQRDNTPTDDNGHGTHVAGIIASVGNNGIGVTGVNWNAKLVSLKFLGPDGLGYLSDAVAAVDYANNLRARGINLRATTHSWAGGGYSSAMFAAITRSNSAGIMFVAAAGNNSSNNDVNLPYPAGYDMPNVISVAATDHNDALASFSNFGATEVDLGAPGVNILSTVPGAYGNVSGTSMAAPHVTGAVALAWAYSPNATVQTVRDALLNGADRVASLEGKVATGGRLNVFNTLNRVRFDVADSNPALGQTITSRPDEFVVNFTTPYASNSVQATDFKVNGIAATWVSLIDADTVAFRYSTSPLTAVSGTQTMQIAGAAISGMSGTSLLAWSSTFAYEAPSAETGAWVTGVVINSGNNQRSNVDKITIEFSEGTNLGALIASGTVDDVIKLYNKSNPSTPLPWLNHNAFTWDGRARTLRIDLTSDGSGGIDISMLTNGRYELRMTTAAITNLAGVALADTDGIVNGTLVIDRTTGAATQDLFQLGGDLDGDADVDLIDLGLLATTLGVSGIGDTDGDGDTDLSDLGLFSTYWGASLTAP